MDLSGETEYDTARSAVWSAIADPERMARLMPGVSELTVIDGSHWNATVKVPVGLGALKMKFECERVDERPLEYALLRAEGKGVGASMSMTTSFTLSGEGERTSLQWQADVQIGGRVGAMGLRVLEPLVTKQVEGVLQALGVAAKEPGAGPAAAPMAPSGRRRRSLRAILAGRPHLFRRLRG